VQSDCVAVVGAGLGGLVAALELVSSGCDVTVFEQASTADDKLRELTILGNSQPRRSRGESMRVPLGNSLQHEGHRNAIALAVVFQPNLFQSNPESRVVEFPILLGQDFAGILRLDLSRRRDDQRRSTWRTPCRQHRCEPSITRGICAVSSRHNDH
jgi:choline dehydrogenase-like flavoprotein